MRCDNRECSDADNGASGCRTMRETAQLDKFCCDYIKPEQDDIIEELKQEIDSLKSELAVITRAFELACETEAVEDMRIELPDCPARSVEEIKRGYVDEAKEEIEG
jgi:hypothetical protein